MASLYADENFDIAVADELRRIGHDVLTARDAGQSGRGIPDAQVLAYAISLRRAVLTFNRWHFVRLHRQTPTHCGIILATNEDDERALAQRIHLAILAESPLDNKLVRVNKPARP